MFECLPVDRSGCANTALKADHLAILHEQRTVHILVTEIKADESTPFGRHESAVPHRTRIVRVELQADRGGIVFADVERDVLDVIVKPVGGSKPATAHDARGLLRVGEGSVFQSNDRLRSALSLQEVVAPGLFARRVLF